MKINAEAWHYFRICVWGAPAMLCLYSLTGWYIGMQNTRLPMFISIMQNVVNIAASCTFVYAFGMKVAGHSAGHTHGAIRRSARQLQYSGAPPTASAYCAM